MIENLEFIRRYGFLSADTRYVGYLYKDQETGRVFSVAHELLSDVLYINEINEGLGPNDNVYSAIVASSMREAKRKILSLLTGEKTERKVHA